MKNKILIWSVSIAVSVAVVILVVLGIFFFVGGKTKSQDNSSNKLTISAASAEAKLNQTVEIPVKISQNPGIMALIVDFQFDSSILQYMGYNEGKVFKDCEIVEKEGVLTLICEDDADVKADGELITLKFKVKSDSAKETALKVVVADNSICNFNEELIAGVGQDGKIKIK